MSYHARETAAEIATLLQLREPDTWATSRVDRDGLISLNNGEARRLLALAEKGASK